MSLTVVKGLQSEIFVPITPPAVWTPVTKELKDMSIALATAAGVHKKSQERFNLAGDWTWRKIENTTPSSDLMVSHGGYDNSDVNKDINCMFPIDRIHELAAEGFIRACAPVHAAPDSWAAAETRRNSNTRLVRPSRRCSKKRMLTQ